MKPILITTMFRNGYFLILPRQLCLLIQKRRPEGYWEFGIRRASRLEFYVSFGKLNIFFRIQERTDSWNEVDKDRIIIGGRNEK